jgi:hypothetical protein
MDAPSCCYDRKFLLPEKQTTRWRFPELSRMRRGPMIRRKSFAVAALVLPVLSLSAAEAKITAIFTIRALCKTL